MEVTTRTEAQKLKLKEQKKAEYQAHRDRYIATSREWSKNNKEQKALTNKKWFRDNPEKSAIYRKRWRLKNKAYFTLMAAKRRAAKLQRTPPWADHEAINFFYECCPAGCHVDHIVPLRGDIISGLHVAENLQWLPALENLRKHNKWADDL